MALAERKMRIMSDKKIGVLGGSGEIGKRCVNILTEKGYTVMASYRTQKPMENNENVYVQLDICNENELCMFMAVSLAQELKGFGSILVSESGMFMSVSLVQ